jgi:hypothetical protein
VFRNRPCHRGTDKVVLSSSEAGSQFSYYTTMRRIR